MRAIWTIASRELVDALRSRLIWIFAAVFGLFAFGLSYFGLVGGGSAGVTGFARTTASLLNLVLLLFPLASLFLGVGAMTGERGAFALLVAQPVTREEVLLGKFLGLSLTLVASTLAGFGAAGLAIGLNAGGAHVGRFVALTAIACALSVCFVSIALAIAVAARSRARALGLAVVVWFVAVILYDLVVVGAAVAIGASALTPAFVALLFLNPVDLARVLGILALDSAMAFGATGASLMRMLGEGGAAPAMAAALAAWIAVPLAGAMLMFRRADL
jgi:Cu-processing system permease protein